MHPSAPAPAGDHLSAQLVQLGFTRQPLALHLLPSAERNVVERCLAQMLAQRTDDMDRLEHSATQLSTLRYEHDRLGKQLADAIEASGAAERKEQLARNRMVAAQNALKAEQEAHRRTRDDAAKARTALTFVRTQAVHDAKKREQGLARTLERFQKAVNDQARSSSSQAGLEVVNCSESRAGALLRPLPEPAKFYQTALAELEDARSRTVEENDAFRRVLLQLAQRLRAVVVAHDGSHAESELATEPITPSSLFDPLSTSSLSTPATASSTAHPTSAAALLPATTSSHASAARSVVLRLLAELQVRVRNPPPVREGEDPDGGRVAADEPRTVEDERGAWERVRALESQIADLRAQALDAESLQAAFAAQSAALESALARPAPVDTFDAEEATREDERLEKARRDMEDDRRRVTESALELGKERAALEAERQRLAEARRELDLASLMATLPPTPNSASTESSPSHASSSSSTAQGTPSSTRNNVGSPSVATSSGEERFHGNLTPSRRSYARSSPLARAAISASLNSVPAQHLSSSSEPAAALSGTSKPTARHPNPLPTRAAGGKENHLAALAAIGTPRKPALRSLHHHSPGRPRAARASLLGLSATVGARKTAGKEGGDGPASPRRSRAGAARLEY